MRSLIISHNNISRQINNETIGLVPDTIFTTHKSIPTLGDLKLSFVTNGAYITTRISR